MTIRMGFFSYRSVAQADAGKAGIGGEFMSVPLYSENGSWVAPVCTSQRWPSGSLK
jgi:hypothetical protein